MLTVSGVAIGMALAATIVAERDGPSWTHTLHVAAVASAICWLMWFLLRGHR